MTTAARFGVTLVAMAVAAGSPARAEGVSVIEKPGHTTEAVVTVDAPPDQVYAFATDYARWPQRFSDIKSAKLEAGGRENARLWFDSRAVGRKVLVQFENIPG